MEKFLKEHALLVHIVTRIGMVLASYLFVGVGWFLILDILGVNTETLRIWDWVMIAMFTKVLILNNVNSSE